MSEEEQAALGQVIEKFTELSADLELENPMAGSGARELDSVSLQEFCLREFQSEEIATLLDTVSQSLIGIESKDISALSFLLSCKSGTGFQAVISDAKHGGQYLRVRQGKEQKHPGLSYFSMELIFGRHADYLPEHGKGAKSGLTLAFYPGHPYRSMFRDGSLHGPVRQQSGVLSKEGHSVCGHSPLQQDQVLASSAG